MIEHFIEFATARSGDEPAKLQAEEVGREYQANGATLPALVAAIAKSQLFRTILPVASSSTGATQ